MSDKTDFDSLSGWDDEIVPTPKRKTKNSAPQGLYSIIAAVVAAAMILFAICWQTTLPSPFDGGSGSQVAATTTQSSAPKQTPAPNQDDQTFSVQQYRKNGQHCLLSTLKLDGLDANMVYMVGFLASPEGRDLEVTGELINVFQQTEAVLTNETLLPGAAEGQRYQVAYYYYSLDGKSFVIGDVQLVELLPLDGLAELTIAVEPTPTPTPTPSPTPKPTEASIQLPQPTSTTTVAQKALPTQPESKLFYLYPVELRYQYHQLSDKHKQLFTLLYDGMCRFDKEIKIPDGYTYTMEDYRLVRDALYYDCPELLQYDPEQHAAKVQLYSNRKTGYLTTIEPPYIISTSAEFDRVYQQVINALEATRRRPDFGATDYSKELCIYRDIIERTYYDLKKLHCAYADSAYAYGYAKCSGYAKAFQLACRYVGIPCLVVIGDTIDQETFESIRHMWNIVRIEGEWYQCDPTWDDPIDVDDRELYKQCLKFFNITDREMLIGRSIDSEYLADWTVPKCTATSANFFRRTMPEALVTGDWQSTLEQRLRTAISNRETAVAFHFTNRSDFDNAMRKLDALMKKVFKKKIGYRYRYEPQTCVLVVYNMKY